MIDEQAIRDAAPTDLPALCGEAARLLALVLARIVTPQHVATCEPVDEWLRPDEVAALLKITPEQVRRTVALKTYRRKLSPKKFVYSRAGINRFLKRQ